MHAPGPAPENRARLEPRADGAEDAGLAEDPDPQAPRVREDRPALVMVLAPLVGLLIWAALIILAV